MSRSKKQRARADFIDLDFLAPPRLRLEETLEIADSELEGLLQTRDVDRRVILINEISKIDRRLEFVLAGMYPISLYDVDTNRHTAP